MNHESGILYLLPRTERVYKANLHTHTTVSDGVWTPERVKADYKERGYQIVAFTDHEVCIPHPELCDEDFLALTGYEIAVNQIIPLAFGDKTYHFCLISRQIDQAKHICFDPRYLYVGHCAQYADRLEIQSRAEREYSLACANEVIHQAREAGYLVAYNHPDWSLQNYSDYMGLEGLWGIEVYNSGCVMVGYDDWQPRPFEDLLRAGKEVFPLAADDMHWNDKFQGWVMVAARSLAYDDVIAALENGDFYASSGPEIHSLTLADGELKLSCSPCRSIAVETEFRMGFRMAAPEGETLREAAFDLRRWYERCVPGSEERAYFRVTLEDASGKRAYTRPYYRRGAIAAAFG